ncbi:MAG: hypothetical protein HGB35_02570 [Geobacteraceae bacterium]|nr:hypothetical protein [Geobacteraceae bacterium]
MKTNQWFAHGIGIAALLTGDGAFQMTAQELSTLVRQRSNAVILIINNEGYLIERVLHSDGPYNDLQNWHYTQLTSVFGGSDRAVGLRVTTEDELDSALNRAAAENDMLFVIELVVTGQDCSAGLKRLGEAFMQSRKVG